MSGINCQIIRNPYNNQIETVEAPNGNISTLYQDALREVQDTEQALNIWAVNYTDRFQELLESKKRVLTPININNKLKQIVSRKNPVFTKRELEKENNQEAKEAIESYSGMVFPLSPTFSELSEIMEYLESSEFLDEVVPYNLVEEDYGVTEEDFRRVYNRYLRKLESLENQISLLDNKRGFMEVSNEGSTIFYKKRGNNIELELIETPLEYRGRGYARVLLEDFTRQADINGETIRLMVAPRDNQTRESRLADFYRSVGFRFEEQFGVPSEFEMVRTPQRNQNSFSDRNGEARLPEVLKYIEATNSQTVEPLTSSERQSVKNMLMGANIPNSDILKQQLQRIFPQGQFSLQSLRASNIFNRSEKDYIEENKATREELKRLSNQLSNQEDTIHNDVDYNENFVVLSGNKNKYGKDEILNPLVVEKEIVNLVAGIENREAFDTAFNSVPYESIVEEYNTNEAFAQEMFEEYSRYKVMPHQTVEEGQLQDKNTPNRATTVENTINLENSNFRGDIQLLSQVPNDVWNDSAQEIEEALSSIESKGRTAAIDLEGLTESYASKTRTEIIDFLATLNNLENVQSQENFDSFLEAYTDFFGVETNQDFQIREMSPENRTKNLVYVSNPLSEYQMFEQDSLIKVDNNIYQRVSKLSLPNAYEAMYAQAVVRDNRILPNEAYFGEDTVDNQRLQNPDNKPEIMNNISYFIERNISQLNLGVDTFDSDQAQLLLLYKYYFNNPINIAPENNIAEDIQSIEEFEGDSQYLSSDYISDFQSEKLRQREQESEVYESVYSQFEIDEQGIKPINEDTISLTNLQAAIEEQLTDKQYRDLKNYSVVSKNRAIKQLFPIDSQTPTVETKTTQRSYYQNNLEALPLFKGDYTMMDVNSMVSREAGDNFIRINNKLFEKAQDMQGHSFYRRIPTTEGNFNIIETQQPVNKFGYEEISSYIRQSETTESTNNSYSQEELETINQNQYDCE